MYETYIADKPYIANKLYSSFAYKFETAPISGRSFWGCYTRDYLGLTYNQKSYIFKINWIQITITTRLLAFMGQLGCYELAKHFFISVFRWSHIESLFKSTDKICVIPKAGS